MILDQPKRKSDWVSLFVTALMIVWVSGVSLSLQGAAWASPVLPTSWRLGQAASEYVQILAASLQAVLLLVPLVPMALLWRAPRYRAAFRVWLAGTLFLLLLAPTRLLLPASAQLTLLAQAALALLFSLLLWWFTGSGALFGGGKRTAAGLAVAIGLLLALPWVLWGALGSRFDVLLAILAALAFALAAMLCLTRLWLRPLAADPRGTGWDIALGGFAAGTLLVVMASAYGVTSTQAYLLLSLSAFGWLAMDLAYVGHPQWEGASGKPILAILFLALGIPLLFMDPNSGVLVSVAAPGETLMYVLLAVGLVMLGALVGGILLFAAHKPLLHWRGAQWGWVAVPVMAVIAGALYLFAGQPGFFGTHIFVIFKDQADVSAARALTDYDARRTFVYQTLTDTAGATQKDLRAALEKFGIRYTPYYLVNGLDVQGDLPIQWWLGTRVEVDRILQAPVLRPLPKKPPTESGNSTRAPSAPEWNLTVIGADRVWNELGVRGAGVIVGQADSGVDGTHPELSAQYRGRDGNNDYNWLDPWFQTVSPTDIGGHGTHTLGSILGKTVGVAPDAEWIGCVNLARNLGNPILYLECMQFDFAPYPQNGDALTQGEPTRGAMVLNNSWGCPLEEGCDANALLAAVRALRAAGVFVVASAGNDGPNCSSVQDPLALYDDVFSVGAVDRNRHLADFSSRGPVTADGSNRIKPDIAAPGLGVYSSLPNGTYGTNSGTSMAGPHIVGVVALMWSANPALRGNVDLTEQILRETAQSANVSGEIITCGDPNAAPNDFVGYGIVDAFAAVQRALEMK